MDRWDSASCTVKWCGIHFAAMPIHRQTLSRQFIQSEPLTKPDAFSPENAEASYNQQLVRVALIHIYQVIQQNGHKLYQLLEELGILDPDGLKESAIKISIEKYELMGEKHRELPANDMTPLRLVSAMKLLSHPQSSEWLKIKSMTNPHNPHDTERLFDAFARRDEFIFATRLDCTLGQLSCRKALIDLWAPEIDAGQHAAMKKYVADGSGDEKSFVQFALETNQESPIPHSGFADAMELLEMDEPGAPKELIEQFLKHVRVKRTA